MFKSLSKYARWLYANSEGARWAIFWNIMLGTANIALNLLFIWFCKVLVDIATGNSQGNIYVYTAFILAIIVARLAINAGLTAIENVTLAKTSFNIRSRLFSNILQSQWAGMEKYHSGDTLNRLMSDLDKVTRTLCEDVPAFIVTCVQLLAAFVFFCALQWKLSLILVFFTPLLLVFSKVFFRRMRSLTANIRNSESKVQSHIQESLQHKIVIQTMETGDYVEGRLDDLQDTEFGQIMDRTRFHVFTRTIVGATFNFGYIIAFLWGVYGIWKGTVTFGLMTAFLQLVGQIQNPSMRLTRQIPSFAEATASVDRLSALEIVPKEEEGDPVEIPGVAGIRIENLTFRYPSGERDIFKDFNFDFPPGSRTALVGETGVGKSTLIRLMLALLRPVSGRIALYGDSEEAEVSALTRRNFIYVPQGNSLFSGTVRDNLLLGKPDATLQEMTDALKTAAAEFVFDLPLGLDTVCGEGGAGLSEGQAQRIAIARGLLRPGSILLLDEFSSSLDAETEDRLMKNLTVSAGGRTMVFITHRERISDFCDRQLRLERYI